MTLEGGDATKGKSYYQMVCGACHGPGAKGNESLHSPNLIGMEDWYVKRQIENFKAGVRGAEPGDLYGSQMLQISNSIQDEQAVLDLTAYFHSLQGE
jgi:cytochrome c oxidase subunit 2